MRKLALLITTLAMAVSVLVVSPAHAAAPPDGIYLCTTGEASNSTPNFTITDGVVTNGSSCVSSVVIPAGVTSIGDYAFTGASSLTSITIPAGVTSIGYGAFQNATALTNIIIPASVTTIGDLAFANTILLTNITVDTENANYSSTEGVLFNKNLTTLINYPTGNSRTSYSIPASVTSIRDSAFYGASALATITFETGSQLTRIGDYAFTGASSLTSITIPAGVTSIGDSAFTGASSLASITIPAGVTGIGYGAFQNATALTNIIIPASVTTIGDLAFANTILLTNITVDTENANYSSTEGVLFNKNLTTLINYPTGNSRTSYSIPASVTSIRDSAFYGVTLLSSVYFLGNAPTVGDNTFSGIASGSKAYIKSTATGFTTTGTPARWNGLTVEVVVDTPAPATETPPANTAGSVVDNSAARAAAALLAARTLGFKKSFAIKTLAKRVGIKIVSSKATVSLTVSKTSKKVCAASKFKLNTLKAGKCKATFTVQEPTPKKGKKPKAKKTTMTLVVK